jgi:hypothetical protein
MCAAAVTTNATAGRTARQLSRRPGLSRTTSSTSRPVTEAANAALAIPGAAAGLGFLYPRSRCGRCMTHNDRPRPAGTATTTVTSIRTTSGMSARLTTTPPWITMQAAVVGAFMIVGSFGHYSAQTAHDHGPPAASHEYPVTLCRSMHKHAQRATPAIRHSLNNPSRVAGSGVVTGHGGCAHGGRSAEADVTGSSEDKLGDRFSTACPLSVVLGRWPHRYGPAELDFPDTVAVRRRDWTAS